MRKKEHGLSLKRPRKNKRWGDARPAPGLLSQPMGLVSARAFGLGLGGPFGRFKFAAHAVADAPTPGDLFEPVLLVKGRTNAL